MTNINKQSARLETQLLFRNLGFGISGKLENKGDFLAIELSWPMNISTLNNYLKSSCESGIKKLLVFQRETENGSFYYTVYDNNKALFSLNGQAYDTLFTIKSKAISQTDLIECILGAH
ncbi:hypothetical protein J4456_02555 [Candidatus Pacearchaeota archaeon]|nr:hypothetical protein [Candidatus Pacearchaeota archaeon]